MLNGSTLWFKKLRFKLMSKFTQLHRNYQRANTPRDGITFGALKQLRKKRQRHGVRKGQDRVLTRVQVGRIARSLKDRRLTSALALTPTQVMDWQSLRDFSEVARFTGEHKAYEQAIFSFDPKLQLRSYEQASFIGSGLGCGTLNAYRKLEQGDIAYFEKIYLNESRDLTHLLWFEENYRPLLDDDYIRAPRLIKVRKGINATAVYFEFLFEPLDNCNRMPEQAIEVALSLYRQPINWDANLPEGVLAFETLDIYQACFKLTQHWIAENGVGSVQQLSDWEAKIKTLPRQLSHGDLHGKNMGEPNIVIDWDRTGLYPFGFDIAYALSNTYTFVSVSDLHHYLHAHCRSTVADEQWPLFLFSCSYFCLLFYIRKRQDKIFDNQLSALYEACSLASELVSQSVTQRYGCST
jgi:hypothetical protein